MSAVAQHSQLIHIISTIYRDVVEQCWDFSLRFPGKHNEIQDLIDEVNLANSQMVRKLNYLQKMMKHNNDSYDFGELRIEVQENSLLLLKKLQNIVKS